MGRRRKEQKKREWSERLATLGPPVHFDEAWDDPGDFESVAPLYGNDDKLPWERQIEGFEAAYDRGEADDLEVVSPVSVDNGDLELASRPEDALDWSSAASFRTKSTKVPERTQSDSQPYIKLRSNQIRVFELAAGVRDDRLYGAYIPVNLQPDLGSINSQLDLGTMSSAVDHGLSDDYRRKISYTAISYCWGTDDKLQHALTLFDHDMRISSTVARLLRALRHPQHSIRLWIDQICIDQDSQQDKESQIKLMSSIYSQAYNTLIWLGEGPEDGAFHLLQSLAYQLWGTKEHNMQWQTTLAPMIAYKSTAMRALMRLFQSPWLSRTWIVQELALSQRPYLRYGSRTISWEDFTAAAVYLVDFDVFILPDTDGTEKQLSVAGVKHMQQLDAIRISTMSSISKAQSLGLILEQTRSASVTLPVDKVYGVMALCDNVLPIEYGVSAANVFEAVARHIFQPFDPGRLLSNIDHDCSESKSPSWVVDWSLKRRTTPLHTSYSDSHQRAGSYLGKENSASLEGTRSLATRALFVDTLIDLSEVVREAQLSIMDPQLSNTALHLIIDFVSKGPALTEQQLSFRDFCGTIVAGQDETAMTAFPDAYIEIISLPCDETTGRKPSILGQTYSQRQQKGYLTLNSLTSRLPKQTLRGLRHAFCNAMLHRRLAWSRQGQLVLVPRFARPGDLVVILPRCSVPYVLRGRQDERYRLVGECYLHHVMNGEYFQSRKDELNGIYIE